MRTGSLRNALDTCLTLLFNTICFVLGIVPRVKESLGIDCVSQNVRGTSIEKVAVVAVAARGAARTRRAWTLYSPMPCD